MSKTLSTNMGHTQTQTSLTYTHTRSLFISFQYLCVYLCIFLIYYTHRHTLNITLTSSLVCWPCITVETEYGTCHLAVWWMWAFVSCVKKELLVSARPGVRGRGEKRIGNATELRAGWNVIGREGGMEPCLCLSTSDQSCQCQAPWLCWGRTSWQVSPRVY